MTIHPDQLTRLVGALMGAGVSSSIRILAFRDPVEATEKAFTSLGLRPPPLPREGLQGEADEGAWAHWVEEVIRSLRRIS